MALLIKLIIIYLSLFASVSIIIPVINLWLILNLMFLQPAYTLKISLISLRIIKIFISSATIFIFLSFNKQWSRMSLIRFNSKKAFVFAMLSYSFPDYWRQCSIYCSII